MPTTRLYKIVLPKNQSTILTGVSKADNPLKLMAGLIGAPSTETSLWLPRTSAVHTYFMKYPLDIAFLDKDGICLRLVLQQQPNRVVFGPKGADSVLETKSGNPSVLIGIECGDKISIEPMA